jgi:hypothetical protein
MKIYGLLVVAAGFMSGCTTSVNSTDIENAHYPQKPSAQETDSMIRGYLAGVLKDRDSLKLECTATRKGWARQFRDRTPEFGWVTPCMVNAKNSFGGYTGNKPYVFLYTTQGFTVLDGSKFRAFEEHVGYVQE